jgi:acetyl esterase/lipase
MPLDPRARRLLDMLALGARAPGAPMTAAERRAGFSALMALSRTAQVGRRDARRIAGGAGDLPARLYTPDGIDGTTMPGLVFFHGGGLVAGDLDTHDGLCRRLSAEGGCRVLSVAYRLAPEHPYPAAIEDAIAATRAVLDDAAAFGLDPRRIAVGGDSAGGTLATLAAGVLGARLRFQLLLCPVLDLAHRRPSRLAYGQGFMLDQSVMDRDLADYLPPGLDPADPSISPVNATALDAMPPAVIHTAECDPLRDEGQAYAEALAAAGVPVIHVDHPGMIHHFLGLEGVLPAAKPALAGIGLQMRTGFGEETPA